ncbi:inward rectifier potassium channel irk-1 isoform X1 [Tribolium castaneum]|uniref:inward rectifier potassium channel irk-1 isoform X1 n=1 Tax=Tribolium castaneum TaxID=7070 RepID=UPI00077DC488|nr:PREDICTED: inward rectifier potassium channel irk-1-like isoform X1 [Tribolium castaneum]|eukprot:XP_015837662.1 PREDICTED: inward rectifier potassium channel irk-1-like isoform X1 [Tribolium castaneum]
MDNKSAISSNLPMVIKRCPKRRNRKVQYNEENRIMSKRGRVNVYLYKIPHKSIRYVRDLWNTLVNMRWRWLMLTVSLINVSAYFLFAELFLLDAWISGDFSESLCNHHKCINGVHNFTSFFMLGIETITTTGYGYFHPTENCTLVWTILTFSTLVTIFIDGAFISVVYVKISRPAYTINNSLFSKKAVICLRNGALCLIFRINDSTGKHWIGSQVNLFLITQKVTNNGELLPNFIVELKLQPYGVLFWPTEIVHEISSESPLWNTSAQDILLNKFELVATLSGSSVLTGQASKSQTSYLNGEILWGYWFSSCMNYDNAKCEYTVNKKKFDKTVLLDTPLCSACDLSKIEREIFKKSLSIDCLYFLTDCQIK